MTHLDNQNLAQEIRMILPCVESAETASVEKVIEGDAGVFQEKYNRASFAFKHCLAHHPLFELPRLVELAKAMPPGDIYYDAGDVRVNQRWDQTPPTRLSAAELIDRIENAGAWILIKRAHRDPRYAAVLHQGLAEVQTLLGPAYPRRIKKCDAYVFITSPNRITTYHIDRECNYLLQVRGSKTISLFDKDDRDVLPEPEIERFWAADNNAAVYKPHYQDRATDYRLTPGTGVHIPVNAPHWVKNDDNISVTLAVTFQFPDEEFANIYRWNHFLRKLGLTPTPPGRSKLRDVFKGWTMARAIDTRNAFKRLLGRK